MLKFTRLCGAATALILVSVGCSAPPSMDPSIPKGGIVVGTKAIARIDPSTAATSEELLVIGTACDGLTRLDPQSGEVEPALAASWSFSEGGLVLTLLLRKGSRFQDGRPVTSDDVRRSLLSVVDPGSRSGWASLLKAIKGAGTAEVADSIRPISRSRLSITLSHPSPDIVSALAHPALVPLSQASTETDVVCSGPYRIRQVAEGGVRLVHVKKDTSEMSEGFLNLIRFVPFASDEEAYEAFKRGEVDASPVPINRVVEAESLGRSYLRGGTLEITYLTFSPGDPQTSDPRVRQALSLAVDRLLLVDAAFGDQREPALRWLPQAFEEAEACSRIARKVSDPDGAKALLTAAGVDPSSVRLKITYDQDAFSKVVAQALEVKIRDVLGIQVGLNPLPPDAFRAAASERQQGTLWLTSSNAQLPTVGERLSSNLRSGGSRNLTGMSDPQVDSALDEAETHRSSKARIAKGVEAEDLVCQKMLAVPLWWGVSHWMVAEVHLIHRRNVRLDISGAPLLRQIALR